MISNMPRYEQMKDSGVEWLGEIPTDWDLLPIRAILEERNERNLGVTDFILSVTKDRGVIPYDEKGAIGNNKSDDIQRYKVVHKNDIVINKMNVVIGSLGLSKYFGALSQVYIVLKPRSGRINVHYYTYLIANKPFYQSLIKYCTGIMELRESLNKDEFKKLQLPCPPFIEQTAIANFLDQKTAKIDQAIALKQKQIELFKERKQLVIQQAVTKGLNPDAPMRDSGVEWIGEIPEHWEVVKLKLITKQIVDGTHFTPTYVESGVPFLRVTDLSNMQNGCINWDNVCFIPEKEHKELIKRTNPKIGDVLLSKNGTIGLTKVIDWEREFSIFVSLCLIKLTQRINAYYFTAFFNSPIVDRQIVFGSSRTSVTNLHLEKIKELLVILPPLKEQTAIVAHIETQSAKIDKAIDIQQQQINKLKEYKATLINSAVTGKIKVC
ncbi:MAG: restriction endonuclease subunit S [Pseudomonadales bacterium]|nr:restriction endonuclease subunit S [Pseudomonadales bacterium]